MRLPDWIYCKLGFHEYVKTGEVKRSGRLKSPIPLARGRYIEDHLWTKQKCRHCDEERLLL